MGAWARYRGSAQHGYCSALAFAATLSAGRADMGTPEQTLPAPVIERLFLRKAKTCNIHFSCI